MICSLFLLLIQVAFGRLGPRRRREPTAEVLAKVVDRARATPDVPDRPVVATSDVGPVSERWAGGRRATDDDDRTTELPLAPAANSRKPARRSLRRPRASVQTQLEGCW